MQTPAATLLERVERLVQASGEPLPATMSTTAVIAALVERIEALEAALREIADAVGSDGETNPLAQAVSERALERPAQRSDLLIAPPV